MSKKIDNPFDKQVGGSHYKEYAIQPYVFFFKNNISHHKAAIIRRILRYDHPTGKGLLDLEKIQHEIELLIHLHGYKDKITNQGVSTNIVRCECTPGQGGQCSFCAEEEYKL